MSPHPSQPLSHRIARRPSRSQARASNRATAPFHSGRLAGGAAILVLFMGSTLLTPLYEIYKTRYALGPVQITSIYAVYVVGNLTALLFLGRLSDLLGRRPIALAGLALAVAGALLFLGSDPPFLYAGRAVSGCAVGLGSGAATAWISESLPEERRAQAASTMTGFNFAGLTLGPPIAGALAQYSARPLFWPYIAYLIMLLLAALLVWRAGETVETRTVGGADFKPRIGVPKELRWPFVPPATAGFVAMAVVGFYAALGPTILAHTLHITNHALSGVAVAELFLIATLVIIVAKKLKPRPATLVGMVVAPFGLAALAIGQLRSSLPLILIATTLCGGASALAYRGGLGVVNALAPQDRRAEVASSYFICCFLGNALPVVGVGLLTRAMGQGTASTIFAGVIGAMAVASAVGIAVRSRDARGAKR